MSERVHFFYEIEKIMTRSLSPYCCSTNRGEIPLLESCCARLDACIGQFIAHNES